MTTTSDGDLDTDVLVIGGGPAGLMLTLLLLRSGVRVVLVEKSTGWDRAYRGEILQPGGQQLLDELGVLTPARARGACGLRGFQLVAGRRTLLDVDYRRLAGPYRELIAMPQRHLLESLEDACTGLPGFTSLPGHRIKALVEAGTTVRGAVVTDGSGTRRISAAVTVGADGRYSKTRSLAGIAAGRTEDFRHDILWFKLHAPGQHTGYVRVRRGDGATVLIHDSYPDRLQIGWAVPHRSWPRLAAQGVEPVRAALAEALPEYAALIDEQIRALADLTLLDVFAARAGTWCRDGLVLVGDAAHTHSPLGAQGINLALQDAAVLHPILVSALAANDTGRERLAAFEAARGPAVATVMAMQRMQAKGMFEAGSAFSDALRAGLAGLIGRSPIGARITTRVAYGRTPVAVRDDLLRTPVGRTPAAGGTPTRKG